MEAFTYLLTNLPLISCIAFVALVGAWLALALRRSRQRRFDTSDWLPALGTVVQRREIQRNARLEVALIIRFATADGKRVEFTDELAAWQVDYGATVPILYDPVDPWRARVIRRRRGRAA